MLNALRDAGVRNVTRVLAREVGRLGVSLFYRNSRREGGREGGREGVKEG